MFRLKVLSLTTGKDFLKTVYKISTGREMYVPTRKVEGTFLREDKKVLFKRHSTYKSI